MTKAIIVEGIDHIGKTTWIKECLIPNLEKQFGSQYDIIYYRDLVQLNTIKRVLPDEDVTFLDKKHYGILCGIINMLNAFSKRNVMFVFDRLHLSGAAYAKGLRNDDGPSEFNHWFEQELKKVTDPLLITFVLDKNQKPSDDDEVVNSTELLKINQLFDQFAQESSLPKRTYQLKMSDGMSNIQEVNLSRN